MMSQLQSEAESLIKSVISLVYFMRGSISYHEMMEMTPYEMSVVSSFLDERLTQETKRDHPNY
jgi:hypothetical protein